MYGSVLDLHMRVKRVFFASEVLHVHVNRCFSFTAIHCLPPQQPATILLFRCSIRLRTLTLALANALASLNIIVRMNEFFENLNSVFQLRPIIIRNSIRQEGTRSAESVVSVTLCVFLTIVFDDHALVPLGVCSEGMKSQHNHINSKTPLGYADFR